MSKNQQRRALVASLIGNSIEWFDYFLYGTAASLVFGKLFFPKSDPTVGLLLSYLTFAIPFFIRPLGGIIFSHIGDKIGRKKTLVLTLMLMGGSTVLIGLLPTYESWGLAAPVLLITLRVIQGLGIGGEWGGALLLAVENSDKKKRGLFGSVPQMGVPIGMLMGTAAMSIMTAVTDDKEFLSWGWRVPFVLSMILVVIGLWIRGGIDESPVFEETKQKGEISKLPIADTFKYHWKEVLLATGMKVVETAPFYILTTFVITYATGNLKLDKTGVLNAVTIASLVTTILIPLMGRWADKHGRKPMYIWGTLFMLLFVFPYFWLLNLGTIFSVTVATIIGLGVIWAPITAVLGTLYSEIFSTNVRYTGVTVGYQLGAALAGGTAPLIATYLLKQYNTWVAVAIYLAITCLISLFSILLVKETKHVELTNVGKNLGV
ncbi:MFS transporter [Effusibacillus lacus]|uniref:Putative proline/betaine transporter n=1 Tax=Effusibacillus lacus TaxID=1348429 RepID=A0A292YI93_9BACL|nr:MFS transporter [Effusibacillus lacus]TCS74770.1 metabolite-proton symporter [Effusibacillus lacus]GAX88581.1 MFS transporter [Effusibacillus lacus]